MAGDWRISADERSKYESYFQQCGPIQGYLSGEQARDFFFKSNLPGDILRKIWDLADITSDGRLDKREFAIACYLISLQVQRKGPLPATLPASLLSDSVATTNNGLPTAPLTMNVPSQPSTSGPSTKTPIPPQFRTRYLQQFHALVDVSKSNGFMTGLQAKSILQQTSLSHILLHQIWNLADHDRDGRLTPDEFVVAMHCCDLLRAGQTLPATLPDEWLPGSTQSRERTDSLSKGSVNSTFAGLNQQLKDTFNTPNTTENNTTQSTSEQTEAEQKAAAVTYEEKRLKNYEDGNKELERRRQFLREQEEREQKEREERERKREAELQKQKDEQDRKKQAEIERQLEKQRQIEQQKDEERRKLFEQREAARKELERKNRLEWERQRLQELSNQKSRLLEQINDLKSREKALGLEVQSMDETIQICVSKVEQTNTIIHTMDESLADIQRKIETERNLLESVEQERKDLLLQSSTVQAERESLESSVNQLQQSKEFSTLNRETDQMKVWETQIESMKHESTQIDEQISTMTDKSKEYQTQMEQLCEELNQLESEVKEQKPPSLEVSSTNSPSTSFANFDQFNANTPNEEEDQPSSEAAVPSPSVPFVPVATSPIQTVDVDPFQTVDPFASQPALGTTPSNNDWFQPSHQEISPNTVDPFLPKVEPPVVTSAAVSPRIKKAAPKAHPNSKDPPKPVANADPWGAPTNTNNGHDWAQFQNKDASSPFGDSTEWPHQTAVSNENASNGAIQYRVLYDYTPERPDELTISAGDIITDQISEVDPSKQQDENWLFGQIDNDKQGFFPTAYTERMTSAVTTPGANDENTVDTTSSLPIGSLVITLADYQGKTVDKHLSFKKGESILVRGQKDATWYTGQLHSKIGWFPRNHVRPATEVETQNTKNSNKNTPTSEKSLHSPMEANGKQSGNESNVDIYEAVYAYEANDPSDLSFDVGERIIVLKCEGDWWTGQIGDRTGTFPNNYVQKVGQNNEPRETAIATEPYQSTKEGHLSFEQNQLIYIRNRDDQGWCEGEIRHPDQPVRTGWFPASSVQIQTVAIPKSPSITAEPSKSVQYIAIFPYDAQHEDELSFPADAVLEIIDHNNTTGWFKARLGEQVGLIPSTYIQAVDAPPSSLASPCYASPTIIPCTPAKPISPSYPFIDDSNITSGDESSPPCITSNASSHQSLTNSARISAIRELIETEQRYVNDLRTVAEDFIKPLSNRRMLNDYEIEQLFSNWFSLIAYNSVFLSTLEEQVHSKDVSSTEDDVFLRTPRSASLSNIAVAALAPVKQLIDVRHRSYTPRTQQFPAVDRHTCAATIPRCPSADHPLSISRVRSSERIGDNIVPQSAQSLLSMAITDATNVGDVLCSYLPYMADAYFQYCNRRSQANKYLQSKVELNDQFRGELENFQERTGGLSLNGFLTKPIQRVTRYPLLIEKILKHTPNDHPDYSPIRQAFECARQLNERINQKICEQENSVRLDWIQQHILVGSDESCSDGHIFDELLKFNSKTKFDQQRQLLLQGLLVKIPSGRELLAFLFNDFLLFTTMRTSSSNWQASLFESKSNLQLKLYRLPILLTDITSAMEMPNEQLVFVITTKVNEKPFVLKAQQTNLRTLWVRGITNAVEEYHSLEKSTVADKALFTLSEFTSNFKVAIARLVLTVQEANDLQLPPSATRERHRSLDPYCEITVNSLSLKTPVIKRTNQPKWNTLMHFLLYNLVDDVIHINIFDHEFFSPNENLGHTSVQLQDILPCPMEAYLDQDCPPITQQLYLNSGSSVVIKCILELL